MSALQAVDDKKKKDNDRIPTWMIAGGIAAVFAVFTAVTVYHIKKSRKQELRDARYGEGYPESNFKSKVEKYWGLTVKTWRAVSTVIGDYLSQNGKSHSPLVSAEAAARGSAFQQDGDVDL